MPRTSGKKIANSIEGKTISARHPRTRHGALALGLTCLAAAPGVAHADCGGVKRARALGHHHRGGAPLVIGDSVVLGAIPELQHAGISVDTHGCRQIGEGLRVIRAYKRAHRLPRVVAIALGTNLFISRRDIHRALRIVGRNRILALVTPREEGGGSGSDAAVERRAARHRPDRIVLLDWVRFSARHGSWFAGDGIHLGPGGARGLARLLHRVVGAVLPRRGRWRARVGKAQLDFTVNRHHSLAHATLTSGSGCLAELPALGLPGKRLHASLRGRFGTTRRKAVLRFALHGLFTSAHRSRGTLHVSVGACDGRSLRFTARPR